VRILQVVTDTDHRGAQTTAVALAQALRDRGHAVETVALAPGTGDLVVTVLGRRRLGVTTLRALRRRATAADVVIAHGSTTLPACAVALLGSGRPFVYRQVSDSLVWAASWARRARVRLGLRRARTIVALGDRQRDVLVDRFGVGADRVTVIPNAVPAAQFAPTDPTAQLAARTRLGLPADSLVAAVIGALVPEKAVARAVRAVAAVTDDALHLLVVGDGPDRADVAALATSLIGARAHVVGPVTDVSDAYASADVVVLASRTESMPTTLIEAALCAVPAVATDVGSVRDVVVDGRTGLVVSGDDDERVESETAAALTTLVRDPELRGRLGTAARAHALARFTLETTVPVWEAVLSGAARPR
jgi:glycosyltransferase involved in cell wall biosynthesis